MRLNHGFPKSTTILLVTFWAVSNAPRASGACYNPNGTETSMTAFIPCKDIETMCCALGRTNPPGGDRDNGETRDDCLPNGLCENRWVKDGDPSQTFWRNFCTDRNWNNETCLAICMTGAAVDNYGNIQVTPCDGTRTSEKWCCGESTDCCSPNDNPDAIVLAQTFGASSTTSSTSTPSTTIISPTISAETSQSISSASASPTGDGGQGGLSTGAKAGIGVGAGGGALILLGLGIFLVFLRRKRRANAPMVDAMGTSNMYETRDGKHPTVPWAHTAPEPEPAELDSTLAVQELPAGKPHKPVF